METKSARAVRKILEVRRWGGGGSGQQRVSPRNGPRGSGVPGGRGRRGWTAQQQHSPDLQGAGAGEGAPTPGMVPGDEHVLEEQGNQM